MSKTNHRLIAGLGWLLLLLAVADWIALRRGVAPHPPWVLALLAAAAVLAFLLRILILGHRLVRRARPLSTTAELVLLCGIVLALAAGSANYLLGLRGAVILYEGESVHLHGGTELQVFEAGPFARLEEMGLFLSLVEVALVPAGDGAFYPKSRLVLQRHQGEKVELEVDPERAAADRTLRFFQGAFGFAPRIEIRRDDSTVFDQVVPFLTELHGRDGISFEGRFAVDREELEVEGAMDLASLDEAMRGHATLALTLRRAGSVLGQGTLLPGHFATLEDGYRVGFTDLKRWSEIDLSRRSYGNVVLAGAAMAALGLLLACLAPAAGAPAAGTPAAGVLKRRRRRP